MRERSTKSGWLVVPDVGDNWRVGYIDCARLLYLAQLRHIAKQSGWLKQSVILMVATVVQLNVRVVTPSM